ncbi:MAG: DoxX family membrane protein [Patescibacteria group bacterium]
MEYIFLLARVVFGGFFIMNAFNHFRNSDMLAGYAASKNVPSPKAAVITSGIFALLGGLGLILGVYVNLSVLLIILFLLPITFMVHDFWNSPTPEARAMEYVQFTKNIALMAGALAFLTVSQPWMWTL